MIAFFKFISILVEVVRQTMDYLNTRKLIEAGKKEQQANDLIKKEERKKEADALVNGPVNRRWLRKSTRPKSDK